ncbi:HAD family hydrolase [Sphingomonas sp. SRS2]|uniref:HAD family hydrolase n=1 Tax=Sphingomonas sp. SRS2 TaxID=133190 RepID=UPI00061843A8|nr:HAD family hydrolase [Sphingomonas sp. SRS2]KKC27897.1 hydrolase [Sphingomonas sp. SRS2]
MKISVSAQQIPSLLDQAPEGVEVLSLDCFDTLLWRNTQAPSDIFVELGIEGGSIEPRVRAERKARENQMSRAGRNEVPIELIHARLIPGGDAAAIAAAVQGEFDGEARHCFAFAPVAALVRDAKRRGLKVVIVSDTYFSATQLRELILRAAGSEIADAIDHVFTSSEHGLSKSEGLFGPVIKALGMTPRAILHLGDNIHADQHAPAALGVATAHFRQFDEAAETRLRHEAMAAVIIDPATRQTVPAMQPHRPLVSLREEQEPAFSLGHDVIGPMLHGFIEWVRDEALALAERSGRPVKPLFLMRDGFLPMKMFETLGSEIATNEVSISRLTAARAGLMDAAAVRALVERDAGKHRLDVLAGQLLLEPHEVKKLVGAGGDALDLEKLACEDETAEKIVRRSARYADRLIAHVRRAGLEDGDMALLIDLGYNGTVQDRIAPLLKARMNVESAGRYLLLLEYEPSGADKKGYFDKRHYGRETLKALGSSIAVIEQICTQAKGSVVDYHPNGKTIHEKPTEKGAQSITRDRIQAGAIAYGKAATAMGRGAASDDDDCRRRNAAAILARFMYLPSADEVAVIGDFTHDANMGSSSHMKMLDTSRATRGLRRRGMHYVQSTARMYLPGELQDQGLALNLALFGIVRGALDVREADFLAGGVPVPVILANACEDCMVDVDAYPTHDGYYRLTVPMRGDLTVAILFGGLYEAVQIEDVSFQPIEIQAEEHSMSDKAELNAPYVQEGMEAIAGDLFRCAEGAALLVPAQSAVGEGAYKLCIAFRPVVRRDVANEARKAA